MPRDWSSIVVSVALVGGFLWLVLRRPSLPSAWRSLPPYAKPTREWLERAGFEPDLARSPGTWCCRPGGWHVYLEPVKRSGGPDRWQFWAIHRDHGRRPRPGLTVTLLRAGTPEATVVMDASVIALPEADGRMVVEAYVTRKADGTASVRPTDEGERGVAEALARAFVDAVASPAVVALRVAELEDRGVHLSITVARGSGEAEALEQGFRLLLRMHAEFAGVAGG